MLEPHNWQQAYFEPSGNYQGMITCIQAYTCRKCKSLVELPSGNMRPPEHGCTGHKEEVKEKWQPPYKDKGNKEIKAKTYPAKKTKR